MLEVMAARAMMMAVVLSGPLAAAADAGKPTPKPRFVVVFDFTCARPAAYGRQLADSVRTRLGRHKKQFKVIDRLTTAELTPTAGVSGRTTDAKIIDLMKNRVGAHVAVFGDVQVLGGTVRAEIRCIDISGPKPRAQTHVFSDNTERARGVIARQLVEAIRGEKEWAPPAYGDEDEPKTFGKALNLNGNFESDHDGWARPDNVSMKIVPDPRKGRKGKVLRLFTDLDRDKWLKYQKDIRLGRADPAKPPPIGTVDNKYATVAGLEGVHFRGAWIPAKAGQRYWLVADMKGQTAGIFFPKIFVKGFADFSAMADAISEVSLNEMKMSPDAFARLPAAKRRALIAADAKKHPDRYRREVFRWYLACRNQENVWKHYAAPVPPRGGLPKNVQFLRIDVYAYWPPGEFLFDDVHLYADPRQKAPLPEEKPRTPSVRPPSTQPATRPATLPASR